MSTQSATPPIRVANDKFRCVNEFVGREGARRLTAVLCPRRLVQEPLLHPKVRTLVVGRRRAHLSHATARKISFLTRSLPCTGLYEPPNAQLKSSRKQSSMSDSIGSGHTHLIWLGLRTCSVDTCGVVAVSRQRRHRRPSHKALKMVLLWVLLLSSALDLFPSSPAPVVLSRSAASGDTNGHRTRPSNGSYVEPDFGFR